MKKLLMVVALLFSANIFATPVNINTADAKTLSESLTGVGPKKAEAIVADRKKNGAFKSADDLKRVSGIGEKTVSANRADILISDVKPATPSTTTPATPAPTPITPAKTPATTK